MSKGSLFTDVVEPSLERIPVLEALHVECHHGRDYVLTQTVNKNIFTEFDRKLSRHLAATRGAGFPAYTVTVTVSERGGAANQRPLASAHHPSVPHALKGIAERSIARNGHASLSIQRGGAGTGESAARLSREVDGDTVEAMEVALAVADQLGETEFLDMSGDFDIVLAAPPGGLKPMVMHLTQGSVSVPCESGGGTITPFECPIYGFAEHAARDLNAQGYLANARHAMVAAKAAAVAEFRAAAEDRILSFDRALGGRPLVGHRLDAATSLVERLKAGLGSALSGLAEDAMITALDWSAEIAGGGQMSGRTGTQMTVPRSMAGMV